MYFREAQKDDIPVPTKAEDITLPENGIVRIVAVNMPPVRRAWSKKAVKKTLTIPAWMEEELKDRKGINIPAVLQKALQKELDIKEPVV